MRVVRVDAGAGLVRSGRRRSYLLLICIPSAGGSPVAGPSEILFVVFFVPVRRRAYQLRPRSGVTEVMAVGLRSRDWPSPIPIGAAIAMRGDRPS